MPLTTGNASAKILRIPIYKEDATVQITELAKQYLRFTAGRGASPRTVENYEATYAQYVGFLMAKGLANDLRHFTPEHVEGFIDYLTQAGRKATSINVKLAALSSLGEFGVKTKNARGQYHLTENPLDRVYRPKRVKPAERYLYKQEIQALLAYPHSAEARLVLELFIDTNLRASELANARVEHLTMDGDKLRLAVVVKGGRPRTVTIGQRVGAMLLESLKFRETKPSDPLLVGERGAPYSRKTISDVVRRAALRAGITRITVRAHVLGRHSMATLASGANVDVPTIAAMLNHSDLNTVTRYVHRQDDVEAAKERIREMLA